MSARVIPVPMIRGRGFGAVSSTAGTYQDPNCPTSCWIFGNVLDMEILGQERWPCHNICPPGQSWDTVNLVCSGSPAATSPEAIPTSAGDGSSNPCPTGQSWNAANGDCETDMSNIWMYAAIGAALLLGGVALAKL